MLDNNSGSEPDSQLNKKVARICYELFHFFSIFLGRAIKVKVRSGNHEDTSKLSRLCGLAVDSGFDFVHYYRNNEIHISVKPDGKYRL